MHFQKHHGLSNLIFHPVMFLDFWYSNFLCKIIILNELGSMKKNQNLHFLTTFFNVISHENPKFNHFLCKMYINISNTNDIAFHHIHIYVIKFFYNRGCEYQISWDLALCLMPSSQTTNKRWKIFSCSRNQTFSKGNRHPSHSPFFPTAIASLELRLPVGAAAG